MPDLVTLLRRLADEYEKEEKGEASSKTEERIDALEAQIAAKPKEEREEAFEELDEDEWKLVQDHRASRNAPAPEPDELEEEQPAKPKMRRGRKRGQVYQDEKGAVGYVYQGDDEDDLVSVDEDVA